MAGAAFQTADATAPAFRAAAVTPNDSTVIAGTRALYIGTGGNLNVVMASGDTVLFSNVPAGILPIQVTGVKSTSTTASNIVALW